MEKGVGPSDIRERIDVVLPSLNPSDRFDAVVDGLIAAGFRHIVIVDDGSRDDCKAHFRRAEEYPECAVLTHPVNRGKGAALKTAFAWIRDNRPDSAGAVTIDGDGQHLTEDILRCAEALEENALVLGSRDFSGEQVPARSRMGNRITSLVFRLLCGMRVSDTQTGLRAFPASLLPRMLLVRGERFDYETNMLLELGRRGVKLKAVAIQTVYEDGNGESHFRPVVDSIRIYRFILLYALSSLAGSLADLFAFYVFRRLLDKYAPGVSDAFAVTIATAGARAISSFLNFNLNREVVFHGRGSYGRAMLRYYCLCVPQMLVSAGLVALLARLAGTGASILTTCIKFVVDTALFFVSFRIQQRWVFRERPEDGGAQR
ncbi:MAG: bifunctional glycosyltransferase family 2/GtrA family protein [Oscillospiraceae bacterium]|nr:bifunctional glycosyltransferase family 2/GtrA family protein [Oscillospiraceae bacterium]